MLKTLNRKIIGDWKAHWKRFFAAWIVVTMGVAFYGAFYPAGKSLLTAIYATYDQLAYMDFQVNVAHAPAEIVKQIRNIEGVAAADGRIVAESGIQLDPAQSSLTNLRLISVPDTGAATVNINDIPAGRGIQAANEILLLKRFADYHHIQPGDSVTLWINGQSHRFEVAGLVFNPEYLVAGRSREMPFPAPSAFGVAWVGQTALAELVGMQGQVNSVVVRLAGASETVSPALRAQVRRELETIFKDYASLSILEREQTASGGVIQANAQGNFQTMAMFSAMFLMAALAITAILLGRLIESERQRIGTLRALGVTRRELVLHYLSFGLLIGIIGGAVGSVLGYFISFVTITPFVDAIAGGYLPGYVNTPQIPFILLGFGITVAATTLAGAYPAWRESGTPPGIALRPAMPSTPNALSRISLKFLPLSLRQTFRNILRAPERSAATAAGIMVGTVMVFASLSLLDSMNFSFDSYFASNQYDLQVLVGTLVPGEALEKQIATVDGVASAQAALFGPITVRGSTRDLDTLAYVLDENNPYIAPTILDGKPAFSSPDGVWIGHNLARVLNVRVGDMLKLSAMDKERQAKVLGIVSQAFGSPVFIPRSLFTQWTPGGVFPVNTALVRVSDGKTAKARDALANVPGVISVLDYRAFVKDIQDYLAFWKVNSWAFAICGIVLTLAVIVNTVSANLHEQQTDLAILRSLGVTQREIVASVLTELLVLAAVGVTLGVPIGREVGFYMAHTVDMEFYGLFALLQPASIPLGVVVILMIVVLAAVPGLKSAFKSDLGLVSKGQSV
jgi:putative ABC transport system permease protein